MHLKHTNLSLLGIAFFAGLISLLLWGTPEGGCGDSQQILTEKSQKGHAAKAKGRKKTQRKTQGATKTKNDSPSNKRTTRAYNQNTKCTDPFACNYNPDSTSEEEFCVYPNCIGGSEHNCAEQTLEIELNDYFNFISIPLLLEDSSIESVFAEVPVHRIFSGENADLTPEQLSEGENTDANRYAEIAEYSSSSNSWSLPADVDPNLVRQLTHIDPRKGYWVRSSGSATLVVSGLPIQHTTYTLRGDQWPLGNNRMVSYPGLEEIAVEDAFDDATWEVITSIQNQGQSLVCPNGVCQGSLDKLKPGRGYQIFFTNNEPVEFHFFAHRDDSDGNGIPDTDRYGRPVIEFSPSLSPGLDENWDGLRFWKRCGQIPGWEDSANGLQSFDGCLFNKEDFYRCYNEPYQENADGNFACWPVGVPFNKTSAYERTANKLCDIATGGDLVYVNPVASFEHQDMVMVYYVENEQAPDGSGMMWEYRYSSGYNINHLGCSACDHAGNILDECGVCGGSGPGVQCWNGTMVCNLSECTGCTDVDACNYNSDASVEDGSCYYIGDDLGNGPICNCEQDIADCAGTCGGNAVLDCTGTCNGSSTLDVCGVCNGLGYPELSGTEVGHFYKYPSFGDTIYNGTCKYYESCGNIGSTIALCGLAYGLVGHGSNPSASELCVNNFCTNEGWEGQYCDTECHYNTGGTCLPTECCASLHGGLPTDYTVINHTECNVATLSAYSCVNTSQGPMIACDCAGNSFDECGVCAGGGVESSGVLCSDGVYRCDSSDCPPGGVDKPKQKAPQPF